MALALLTFSASAAQSQTGWVARLQGLRLGAVPDSVLGVLILGFPDNLDGPIQQTAFRPEALRGWADEATRTLHTPPAATAPFALYSGDGHFIAVKSAQPGRVTLFYGGSEDQTYDAEMSDAEATELLAALHEVAGRAMIADGTPPTSYDSLGAIYWPLFGDTTTVVPPHPIDFPKPEYPREYQLKGVNGIVWLKYQIGVDGRVEPASLRVLWATDSLFSRAATTALQGARFKPGTRDGQAVRSGWISTIRFIRRG
jgi:TonB family protein